MLHKCYLHSGEEALLHQMLPNRIENHMISVFSHTKLLPLKIHLCLLFISLCVPRPNLCSIIIIGDGKLFLQIIRAHSLELTRVHDFSPLCETSIEIIICAIFRSLPLARSLQSLLLYSPSLSPFPLRAIFTKNREHRT